MKLLKLSFLFTLLCAIPFFQTNVSAVDKYMNIAFVGLYGSGKSALRAAVAGEHFDYSHRSPTRETSYIETNFWRGLGSNEKHVKCRLYDCSGDTSDRETLISSTLKDMNMVVLTIDATDYEAVEMTYASWILEVLKRYPSLPILIVGTKYDAVSSSTINRIKEELDTKLSIARRLYPSCFLTYTFVSAKTGYHIGDRFNEDKNASYYLDDFWERVRCVLGGGRNCGKLYDRLPSSDYSVNVNVNISYNPVIHIGPKETTTVWICNLL